MVFVATVHQIKYLLTIGVGSVGRRPGKRWVSSPIRFDVRCCVLVWVGRLTGSLDGTDVANCVTGRFIQKARMHLLLYRYVLRGESFGGTDEAAVNKDATTQPLAERRVVCLSRSILLWYVPVYAFEGSGVGEAEGF